MRRGSRYFLQAISQGNIPFRPILAGGGHLLVSLLPGEFFRACSGPEGEFVSAVLEHQAVLEPVLADELRRETDAARIADLRERERNGFHDVLTVSTSRRHSKPALQCIGPPTSARSASRPSSARRSRRSLACTRPRDRHSL